MFSMAVAGLAKSLIAVTVTLNPAAVHHGPGSDTIRPGDTLSQIAARAYGRAADWPAVWWANRGPVPDPDLITAGQRLALPGSRQVPPWLARAALAAAAAVRPASAAPAGAAAAPAAPAQASSPAPASSGGVNWSAIAACESGGNWAASTGNGFLRRAAVHRADLARLRRRPVRFLGEPGHPGPADRRGPGGPGGPGHRRLARVRGARVVPAPGVTCLHRVAHRRGQAGGAVPAAHPAVIPAMTCARMSPLVAVAAELDAAPGHPLVSRRAGSTCSPPVQHARPGHPAALGTPGSRARGMPGRKMPPKSCAAPNSSGRAPRRSRNTMRVKPYAIRFPSRNARHTALSAPGGCMSTSGCSCRYRSSLRTCSGGPGETSCTGQYRYPASGQRNGFPKSPATRHRRRGYECLPPPCITVAVSR